MEKSVQVYTNCNIIMRMTRVGNANNGTILLFNCLLGHSAYNRSEQECFLKLLFLIVGLTWFAYNILCFLLSCIQDSRVQYS
jgi:hypothetical protein